MSELIKIGSPGSMDAHLKAYLGTDGADGHLADFTLVGGPAEAPCLILKTTGRQTHEPKLLPLIYGEDAGRFVIVASKGGAPTHPAWFLNLEADPKVAFQVIDKTYRGVAHVAQGGERERLYAMMAKIYPPYIDYQKGTDRQIPVVLLEPQAEIAHL